MLKIQGPEIEMEGSFGDMINEVARLMHNIAKEAENQFKDDTEGEVNYDHIIGMILEELARMKAIDANPGDIPKEVMKDFYDELKTLREEESSSSSFIDFDSNRPTGNEARNIIQSAIKDVFTDTRNGGLDIDDIKAIRESEKKSRDAKRRKK